MVKMLGKSQFCHFDNDRGLVIDEENGNDDEEDDQDDDNIGDKQ